MSASASDPKGGSSRLLSSLYREGTRILREGGIEEAALDAWYLLEHVGHVTKAYLYAHPEARVSEAAYQEYVLLLKRRLAQEPVQYLTGEAYFYGLPFRVTRDTLIPRQDTEVLVETALACLNGSGRRGGAGEGETSLDRKSGSPSLILDLCTGSGCVLIALLREFPLARGIGTDISAGALAVAKANAGALLPPGQAGFLKGDLFCQPHLQGKAFDLITANPPYIETEVVGTLEDKVRLFEPRLALDGGEDGLSFYRRIAVEAPAYLKCGGWICVEIGYNQGAAVQALFEEAGYQEARVWKDLSGLDRVVSAFAASSQVGCGGKPQD